MTNSGFCPSLSGNNGVSAAQPGATIGPFVLGELLDGGGLGTVFRATAVQAERDVVLKVPRTDAPTARWQLRREGAVLERLQALGQPNVVRIIASELSSDNPWLAIELVHGWTLGEFASAFHGSTPEQRETQATQTCSPGQAGHHPALHGRPQVPSFERPDADRVLAMLGALATSVAALHDIGVVHGDLSARNVLVRASGEPVLIDFGSALETFDVLPSREVLVPRAVLRGTPGYAAPEQYLGRPVDHRSDLYALGALTHQLLAGAPPAAFASKRPLVVAPALHQMLAPEDERALVAEVARLLEVEPYNRPSSAWPLATLLLRLRGNVPPSHVRAKRRELHRAALIGRTEIMRALSHACTDAAASRGGTVLLTGGSGLGKTRLLNELIYSAAGAGFQTFAERGIDPDRARASTLPAPTLSRFSSWLEYVKDVATSAGPFEAAVQAAAEQLGRDLVSYAELPSSPELLRARLFDSLLESLVQVSKCKPLVIAIDDLQWADPLIIAFLGSERAARLAELPIVVVGTVNPIEVSLDAMAALEAVPALRVTLSPLSPAEVREMVCSMNGSAFVAEDLVEAAQKYAAGAPLLVSEYVHDWVRARDDDAALPLARAEGPAAGDMQVPEALRSLFERRLSSVGEHARQVLTIAAVLGTEFDEAELAQLSEMGAALAAHEVTQALQQLRQLGILVQRDRLRTAFAIGGMRHYCLRALEQTPRAELLGRVARACDELGIDPARSGYVWAEAGCPERAYPRLVRAAAVADAHQAVGVARQLYAQAACEGEKLAAAPELSVAAPRQVYERLGDLLLKGARQAEAIRWYEKALELTPRGSAGHVTLLRKLGEGWAAARVYERAFEAFRGAEAANPMLRADDCAEWLEVQQGLFWLRYYAGPAWRHLDPTPLATRIASIEPVVEGSGTVAQRIAFHHCVAASLMAEGRFSPSSHAVHHARQALSNVQLDPSFAAVEPAALFYLAFPLLWSGAEHLVEAEQLFERAAERAAWFEDVTTLGRAQLYLTVTRRRLGSPDKVLRSIAATRRLAERVRSTAYTGAALACESWAQWRTGRQEVALRLAEQAQAAWSQGKLRYPFQWLGSLVLAELYRLDERFDEASAVLVPLLDADLAELAAPLRAAIAQLRDADQHAWPAAERDQALHRVTRVACELAYL